MQAFGTQKKQIHWFRLAQWIQASVKQLTDLIYYYHNGV
jgi:hypothetical protein